MSQPGVEPRTSCTAGNALCKEPFERHNFGHSESQLVLLQLPPQAAVFASSFELGIVADHADVFDRTHGDPNSVSQS